MNDAALPTAATSGVSPASAGIPLAAVWRPALLRYGYDVCASLLLALPLRNATVASGVGALPDAARAFHADGGLWLLEVLRTQQASLLASVLPVFWSLLLLSALALVPEWWLLRQLALATGAAVAPRRALTRLGALALGTWALRGAAWLGALLLAAFVRSRLRSGPDERVADLAAAAVLAVTLILQLGVSLLRDLVAVLVVRRSQRVLAALNDGARRLRAQAARLTAAYSAQRTLCLATLLGAHGLSVALAERGHAGLCLLVVLFGLALRGALDALWLRWLMRRVG